MTTIVAKKENGYIHLCADTRVTYDYERIDSNVGGCKLEKLVKINNEFYIASCGESSLSIYGELFARTTLPESIDIKHIIEYMFKFRQYYKSMTDLKEIRGNGFIIFKDKIFQIFYDSNEVFEMEDFVACGSGRYYAIAALHLGKSAKEAVELSCKLDAFSELPIQEYKIYL